MVLARGSVAPSLLGTSQARFYPNRRTNRASAELGTALLEQQKHLFALWYQVRDGTLSRPDLIAAVVRIRARVHELCMKQPVTRSLHRRKRRGQNSANLSAIAAIGTSDVVIYHG